MSFFSSALALEFGSDNVTIIQMSTVHQLNEDKKSRSAVNLLHFVPVRGETNSVADLAAADSLIDEALKSAAGTACAQTRLPVLQTGSSPHRRRCRHRKSLLKV